MKAFIYFLILATLIGCKLPNSPRGVAETNDPHKRPDAQWYSENSNFLLPGKKCKFSRDYSQSLKNLSGIDSVCH